jgi:hypothetical protein
MMNATPLTRRQALKTGLAAALAGTAPAFLPSRVIGRSGTRAPNSRIRLGIIGNGLIAKDHRAYYLTSAETEVVALCDVNRALLDAALAEVRDAKGACDGYANHLELLSRDDIDAVLVSTPDHWHAAIAIDAMRMGKDVYIEKPMTLTVDESRAVKAAAKRYSRIVQVGTQQRSDIWFRKAAELMINGRIGEVRTIVASLGEFPPPTQFAAEPVPDGFDYDRWLGPAPWEPYHPKRVVGSYGGGWRCFWEYGSRKNGDWGAHHFDIIQWALGMDDSGPVLFVPKGYEGEPHQYHVYANGTKVIRDGDTRGHMIRFIGDQGEVLVGRDGRFAATPASLKNHVFGSNDRRLEVSDDHRLNWLDAVRTGSQPICHVGVGHRTGTLCCLSGIAERLGRPVRWDPQAETVIGDAVALRMLDRPRRASYKLPS